ncbi:MAG: RNA polymerase sigma factor, partial [Flavisolibacter sp.]
YGKLVSVLTGLFGPDQLDLAEDVVQDSLLTALKDWTYNGVPDNQTAWLYKVARNKAFNILNRDKYKRKYAEEMKTLNQREIDSTELEKEVYSNKQILDDQLRMMFTCCNTLLTKNAQVVLTLKTLCGFSISEIARAFFTSEDTINKKLVRSRQKIRDSKQPFGIPEPDSLDSRLEAVLETIYLLFNEGYNASSGDILIRKDLCEEAIRLADIIILHPAIKNKSKVYALQALMTLNASRFSARLNTQGQIHTLAEQNRALWDKALIEKGFFCLGKSTTNKDISVYHILATISAYHCIAHDFESTDWESILALYDNLLKLDSSTLVLLNRSVAIFHVFGPVEAINELLKIQENPSLKSYHLFYSTLAEFYLKSGKSKEAAECLEQAILYSPLKVEKEMLERKLISCR